jgi:hypothetical protein
MTSRVERMSFKDIYEPITIKSEDEDEESDFGVTGRQGVDGTKKNGSTPHRPSLNTPPSSQRADRGGKGVQYGSHLQALTPTSSSSRSRKRSEMDDFLDDSETTPGSNSSPSSRRKKRDTFSSKSKWEDWEDDIILKALLLNGEKKCDWKGVLQQINAGREQDDLRTAKAISCHWASLKSKLLLPENK